MRCKNVLVYVRGKWFLSCAIILSSSLQHLPECFPQNRSEIRKFPHFLLFYMWLMLLLLLCLFSSSISGRYDIFYLHAIPIWSRKCFVSNKTEHNEKSRAWNAKAFILYKNDTNIVIFEKKMKNFCYWLWISV